MKQKSIKKNAVLNVIKVLMTAIFPLITFPYATRVLGAGNIGKVQFATSFIAFFLLFAALGINGYAVREGAPLREDRKKISKFSSEIFSINIIFTFITYLLLFLILIFPTRLTNYTILIWIFSIQIIFTTIGVDWIYTIYEDYFYITIRSIAIQFLSLILMFIFVKDTNDYYIYALITVLANSSVYIINFFHSKKYIDLKFTFDNNFKKHIRPLFILFSNDLAQQVYINSDLIMLGLMATDFYVGLYTVSVKIYSLVKKILNSIIAVTIPRMAYYNEKNKKSFYELGSNIFNLSILLLLPVMLLLFLLSDNLVILIAGSDYILGGTALKILSVGLLFAVFANLFCNGILIVKKLEKYVLNGTMIAAISNVILNFLFIKLFKQNGAAITTVISEFIIMIYSYFKSRQFIKINNFWNNFFREIIGCLGILLVYIVAKKLNIFNNIIFIFFVGTIGLIIYFLIELLTKNSIVENFVNQKLFKKENKR